MSQPLNEVPPTRSITQRVVIGAWWLMAWRMLSRSLGFLSVIILAGVLVPDDFGIVALSAAVTASIDGLSQLGVRDALVRLKDEQRNYYDTAFSLQVARGLLTGALIFTFGLFATKWLAEPRLRDVLFVLAGTAVVAGFENIGTVTLSRTLDFRMQFLLQVGPRILGFVVTTILALLLRSYWALIIGSAVNKLLGVAATYVISAHRPRFGLIGWRYLISFSLWTWAGGLAVVVWSRSDPFLLGPVLGTGTLGVYMIASEIAVMPVTELIEPATAALFPGFALARRSGTDTLALALSVAGALALCAIPFSIAISASSGFLVASVLGARWDAAQPVIAVLAWLCLFSPFSYVSVSVLSARGEVRRMFVSNAIAAALKVATVLAVRDTQNLVLIAATCVATVAFEALIFLWQLQAAGRAEFRQLRMTIGRAMVSTSVTCAVLYLIPGTWEHSALDRLTSLAAGIILGCGTFGVFGLSQATLWLLSGRPPGAEARLKDLIRHHPFLSRHLGGRKR